MYLHILTTMKKKSLVHSQEKKQNKLKLCTFSDMTDIELSCPNGPKLITLGTDKQRYIYVWRHTWELQKAADIDLLALFKMHSHVHLDPAVCVVQSAA